MKINIFYLWVGSLVYLLPGNVYAEVQHGVKIQGTVLHSFSDSFYFVQSGSNIISLHKNLLSPAQRKIFEYHGYVVSTWVPGGVFASAWTIPNEKNALVEEIKPNEFVEHNKDWITLRGQVLSSSDSQEYLIQVGDVLYKIDEKKINAWSGTSNSMEIRVPHDAILYAWQMPSQPTRSIASLSEPDRREHVKNRMILVGKSALSFSAPHVLVETSGWVYQIKKSDLSTSDQRQFESAGARVDLNIPVSALAYAWKAVQVSEVAKEHDVRSGGMH